MNIAELKKKLGVETLGLSYLKDEATKERAIDPKTQQPTKWLRNWNDTERVQIVVHEDTTQVMKTATNLAIVDKGVKTSKGSGKPYQLWVIVAYAEDDITF